MSGSKKLPPFEDWKAPWETNGEKFDADRAKKLIYDLTASRDEARSKRADADARVTELQEEVSAGDSDAQKEISRLKQDNDKLAADAKQATRLRVAVVKGLSEKQVARLVGETYDELATDADDYLKELKSSKGEERDGEDDDDEDDNDRYDERGGKNTDDNRGEDSGRRNGRLRSGYGNQDEGAGSFDPAKLAGLIPRGSF